MVELQPVIETEISRRNTLSSREKFALGAGCVVAALGAFGGYKLVDSSDQDEAALTARNAAIDDCLVLEPEQQLAGCASELIQRFGIQRYVNIDNVSLSAGGSLAVKTSTNAELINDDLKQSKRSLGFEPENPAYKVGGALVGGIAGFIFGAGIVLTRLDVPSSEKRKAMQPPAA